MYRLITIFSIFIFSSCSSSSTIKNSCDVCVVLDDFINDQNIINKDELIILMNFNKDFVEDNQYKVTLIAYDKNMPYGIEEERNRFQEYGIYSYKGFKINITSENNINLEKIIICFDKVSSKGFFNPDGNYGEIGLNINYDPPIKNYILNHSFKYLFTYDGIAYPDYIDNEDTKRIKNSLRRD